MINIGLSFFSNFDILRVQLWEKASASLDQILYSPWTKWAIVGGGTCLAGFAISRVRSPLVQLDKKLALLEPNSDPDQLIKLFQELTPLRSHWFYAKRWTTLKSYLQSHSNLVETFCERLIEHQIFDPKNDWLLPATELISFEQLSQIYKVGADDLKKHAEHIAKALENPPENLETMRNALGSIFYNTAIYVGQALHSFTSTFIRAHDFSSDENQTMVQRHEARWHLTNFYDIIGKPVFLIMAIYSFLQPKTRYRWIPYVGTLCSILAMISLIKFFHVFLQKKKTILSHDFRNLSEEARQGKLPVPLDCPEVFQIANCFTPLNQDSLSVLLIGAPGIGKDVLVHAFVHAIEDGLFPLLEGVDVHTVNASELKESGGGTGHLYLSRIQILVRDLKGKEHFNVIFINEAHTLNPKKDHPGGHHSELGQQIKTFIETGKLHIIGATTLEEYKNHIEWDKALDRRFVKIFLKPSPIPLQILETYLSEQYPTVTVEKNAIEHALTETNKTYPEIAQPAKAKQLLAEAARSVIGNYGEQEKELFNLSTNLKKERRFLKRNPTDTVKAEYVADLAESVKQKEKALQEKRQELSSVTDLIHNRIKTQEYFTRLAHRISTQPEKSDLEMKIFLLVRRLLDKTKKIIDDKEQQLDKKGIRIKVNVKLINELLASKV
jgi:ATP-dependent Clp protease ATP-binding subunit ClpA